MRKKKKEEITSIQLTKSIVEELKNLGKKGETSEQIIRRLIKKSGRKQ